MERIDSGERSISAISSGVSGLTSSYVVSATDHVTFLEEAMMLGEPTTTDCCATSRSAEYGPGTACRRSRPCAKDAPTPLADGEVIAGYTILRSLGAGGMGEVYLAQHPRLPRRDALKVLSTAVCVDSEDGQRFNREADIVATLWHPHIVQVHDRGEVNGRLWIAMDYVEGTDAARLLAEHYPEGMPPDEVLRIITAVAEALDYAHQRNLTHRDVKPANILISKLNTGDERIMLADFGIARRGDDASGLTGTNITLCTVAYAAPEQLKGEEIDGRADQYALAATAFQLLTGSPPFQHSNPAVVISQHLTSAPPDIASRRPELSGLGPAFDKALAKSRDDRYHRCIDFARALADRIGAAGTGVQADATILAPADTGPRYARAQAKRLRCTVVPVAVATLTASAIAAIALVVVSRRRSHPAHARLQPRRTPTAPGSFASSSSHRRTRCPCKAVDAGSKPATRS